MIASYKSAHRQWGAKRLASTHRIDARDKQKLLASFGIEPRTPSQARRFAPTAYELTSCSLGDAEARRFAPTAYELTSCSLGDAARRVAPGIG